MELIYLATAAVSGVIGGVNCEKSYTVTANSTTYKESVFINSETIVPIADPRPGGEIPISYDYGEVSELWTRSVWFCDDGVIRWRRE